MSLILKAPLVSVLSEILKLKDEWVWGVVYLVNKNHYRWLKVIDKVFFHYEWQVFQFGLYNKEERVLRRLRLQEYHLQ